MEAIAQVAIEHSVRLIALGANVPSRIKAMRAAFAWLLHVGPLISREFYVAFCGDRIYAYLVWYERVAHGLGLSERAFFFDGVPASAVLLGAQASICLPDEVLNRMSTEDVVHDRTITMTKLTALDPRSDQAQQLSTAHKAPDLPAELPMQIRIFVSRTRAVNNGIRYVHANQPGRQCENEQCCRLFFFPDAQAMREASRERTHAVPYLAALGLERRDGALHSRFCCQACAQEWLTQASSAAPDSERWLPPALTLRHRAGRGRCASELRTVLSRNTKFKKHIENKRKKRYPALGASFVRHVTQQFVDALNVDTAALFLGTLLLESSLLKSDDLPGVNAAWRTTKTACALARSISSLRGHGDEIIETAEPGTPVLRRVRARALHLNCF